MRKSSDKSIEIFDCESCGKGPLTRKEVSCDHIEPCESLTGFDGWSEFIRRTIEVSADGLQWICKECHSKKSARENSQRRKARKQDV